MNCHMPFIQNRKKKIKGKKKKKNRKEGIEQSQSELLGYSFEKPKFNFFLKAKRNKYLRYAKHTNVIDFPGTFQT